MRWHGPHAQRHKPADVLPYEPDIGNVKQGEREEKEGLLNARLALEPPDILHDLIDILGADAVDLRHVAEFPMVRLDAVGRSPLEGRIPVMIRLVDLMH